ncbi:MAG: efflux RND transporter periplasmic adaptor subunit [Rhizobiaceae bacterium]|nr:efflux RND transporter periplasmic adaptor subunit [Rhizobiaceae bacterium]MCV0408726.1 efflux RND transporter periplasmic adaptor subunit [Rhizobiaceae bacterium]
MPKFRFHKLAALVVLAGTAVWVGTGEFSSVGSGAQEPPPPAEQAEAREKERPARTVAVAEPPRVEHARAIRVAGTTAADKRARLATRAGGIVGQLPVEQGDRVEKDDLILRLAVEDREIAVESARQLLEQRQAEAEAAERLLKSGTVGRLQLDNARSALAQARLQLETAQAELARNEVRAPFSGILDRLEVEQGSAVTAGAEVATLISLDPIIGRGEVSERDLGFLKPGDHAEMRLVDGRTVEGEVRYISRDATDATRTFMVEVAIPNPDGNIPAGMTAEITLRAEPVDAVKLPRSVVTLGDDGELGIRAVDANGKVAFFPIDLVDDTPDGLFLAGIPPEARIIVAGQEMVHEGETVNAVPADPSMLSLAAEPAATE